MGRRGPQSAAAKAAKKQTPAPKAQGTGANKRTPTGAFDPAAGKDIYEPEKIIAQRIAKGGVTQWQVKWKGYNAKDNTWEPIENLSGCEDMIAEFKEREKTRIAQLEASAEAKRIEKEAEAAAKDAELAQQAAAERVAAQVDGAGNGTPKQAREQDQEQSPKSLPVKPVGSRRTSPFWGIADETGCAPGTACCKLLKANGELCGEVISTTAGACGLSNHCMYKHPNDYIRLKPASEPLCVTIDPQSKMNALPAKHRDAVHKAIVRWLVKRKRPLSLPEDKEFHDVWNVAMRGAYTPPDHKQVLSDVLLLSGEGKKKLYDVNTSLLKQGIKPAMAGDIWSDRGVSLLCLTEYYMSGDASTAWKIKELVLAAKPFSVRHTGEAIDLTTRESCVEAGLTNDVFSSVFFPVSDDAANMKNGWAAFGRGPCCVHTGQLSVHVFLNHSRIKPTRDKEHGIVAHFSHATGVDGLGALHNCQRECNLPEHHPVKDNDTRWSSGHDQMEWFRVDQRAIQLYDVNHLRKAGDAYKQHQVGLEDWRINLESVAVLQPVADWTQHMQGTKYPTLPLVLPTVYGLIDGMSPDAPLTLAFQGQTSYELEPKEMHDGVLEARTEMYEDWVLRWITNLDPEVKRTYSIAALLHLCFKSYDFIDDFELIPVTDQAWALRELRTEWSTVWKPHKKAPETADSATPIPAEATPTAAVPPAGELGPSTEPPKKQRKVTLGGLLGGRIKKEAATPAAKPELDELEEYLTEPEETDLEVNPLVWWQAKESKWPALAKMVKQYFAAPASSAVVERVFSAAGKMHGELQKSAKDSTLEHSLFAAFNND